MNHTKRDIIAVLIGVIVIGAILLVSRASVEEVTPPPPVDNSQAITDKNQIKSTGYFLPLNRAYTIRRASVDSSAPHLPLDYTFRVDPANPKVDIGPYSTLSISSFPLDFSDANNRCLSLDEARSEGRVPENSPGRKVEVKSKDKDHWYLIDTFNRDSSQNEATITIYDCKLDIKVIAAGMYLWSSEREVLDNKVEWILKSLVPYKKEAPEEMDDNSIE